MKGQRASAPQGLGRGKRGIASSASYGAPSPQGEGLRTDDTCPYKRISCKKIPRERGVGKRRPYEMNRRERRLRCFVLGAVKCHGSTLFRQKPSKREKGKGHPHREFRTGQAVVTSSAPCGAPSPQGEGLRTDDTCPYKRISCKKIPRERGVGKRRPYEMNRRERRLRCSAKENNAIPTAFTTTNTCA